MLRAFSQEDSDSQLWGRSSHERKGESPFKGRVISPAQQTPICRISQIVDSPNDEGLEPNLPNVHSSTSYLFFGIIRDDLELGPVSPVLEKCLKERRLEQGLDSESACGNLEERRKTKRWACRNVYGLSLTYVMLFTAYMGLQNLQSSINSAGGLGLITLSLINAMFIAAGFIAPSILKLLGTKYSLLFGFLCHLAYTLCNYYPSWYTLVPGSILIGFSQAPLWAAASTHLAEVAITVASSLNKKKSYLIGKFTAIFFFFFQFSQFPGNLTSSLILFPYGEGNLNFSSANNNILVNYSIKNEYSVCHNLDFTDIDVKYLYILVSVYVVFIVTAIVLLLVFVDQLPTTNKFFSTERKFELYLKTPLIDLVKVLKDVKMLLIAPIAIFPGLEMSFAFGTFTQHYISQCSGTYMVGFTLIVFGLNSALWSYIYSKCLKCIPRFLILLFGVFLSMCSLLFMLFWEREPNLVVFFSLAAVLGTTDAIWNAIPSSLTGVLFSQCSDVAYSAFMIWEATGFTIGYFMAQNFTFHGRIWVMLGVLILAAITDVIVEFSNQKKEELIPCFFCRRHRKSHDISRKSGDYSKGSGTTLCTPAQSKKNGQAVDELIKLNSSSGQNPIFIMYQGRRPSTLSMMSSHPNNGFDGAVTDNTYLTHLLPNGQNPVFLEYQGRRPSVMSAYSTDSFDSLDCTLPSLGSPSSIPPPTAIARDAVRALSPIHECEDHEDESPGPVTGARKVSIQRSDSYVAALNNMLSDC